MNYGDAIDPYVEPIDMTPRFAVTLGKLGFHVIERETGSYVFGHARSGCRLLNGVPTFAARRTAQCVADDLNDES